MSNFLEEKLREAACFGDVEAVLNLLTQNIDINSKNPVNGWSALHWAAKRGQENVVRLLLNQGADADILNSKGESPRDVCDNDKVLSILTGGEEYDDTSGTTEETSGLTLSHLKSSPINGQLDLGKLRPKVGNLSAMPTTMLPAHQQSEDLVLNLRVSGSGDPDFIEIEIPRWKLTYANLLKICCEELEIDESQVERIRKLPNTRLRKDSDVKRLRDYQSLELVLKAPLGAEKSTNSYQSISSKNQTILY